MRKTLLRTDEMHQQYLNAEKNPDFYDSTTPIEVTEYWKIIPNQYPYDAIAEVHHLLVPVRKVVNELDLNVMERVHLDECKAWIRDEQLYDMIIMNFPHQQSAPQRLHYHLIKLKTI